MAQVVCLQTKQINSKMSKHFAPFKFGPISVGHRRVSANGHGYYVHGYARKASITFGAKQLHESGVVVDPATRAAVECWLMEQWNQRILLSCEDPLLDQFKTLSELGAIDINILPDGYGPDLDLSCVYVFDMVAEMVTKLTNDRCWVQMVQLWEFENHNVKRAHYPTK